MNSFSVIAMDNAFEEIKAVLDSAYEFPQEKLDLALDYQWVSRVLSECHQLYQLFDWNWRQLQANVCCDYFDCITDPNGRKKDLTLEVNGLTANVISAGKGLIDYLQASSGKDEAFKRFNDLRVAKYSKKSAYYLLYELRNYVQHGQLIVATYAFQDRTKACFDLFQLKDPLFFTPKGKLVKTFETNIGIIESVKGEPKLSFGLYMDLYNVEIRELYLEFLKCFKNKIKQVTKSLFFFLNRHPRYLTLLPDGEKCLFYKQGDDLHLIMGLEVKLTGKPYLDCLDKTKKQYEQAKKQAKKRQKNFLKIKQ